MLENNRFPNMIEIGELRAKNGATIPAYFPLGQTNGLCFLTHQQNHEKVHNMLQKIALDIARLLPKGLLKFTFFDGTALGQNFAAMTGISPKLKGERILTKQDQIQRALDELNAIVENNIQNVLGFRYKGKTLSDYNEQAGELAKPYNVLL